MTKRSTTEKCYNPARVFLTDTQEAERKLEAEARVVQVRLRLESLKYFTTLISRRLVNMFSCQLRGYLEPCMYLSLYRVSLCRNQLRVNFLGVCVHLILPERVSLASSMPPCLRCDSLWGPSDPISHSNLCPVPTPIPSTANPGSLTFIC